jgi:epoxide hydrolase-like protein
LRARIAATRWPDKETVEDDSQGVPLALMQDLARYWLTEHDWRKCEARLNAVPNFITEIDGLDIHFIHVRSKHEDALPIVVCHGWPGSIVEQLKSSTRLLVQELRARAHPPWRLVTEAPSAARTWRCSAVLSAV